MPSEQRGAEMSDATAAMAGVLVGAGLSYVREWAGWLTRRRSLELGAAFELRKAQRALDQKMRWLKRPADEASAPPDRLVKVQGQNLFLGEDEEFQVPLVFWESQYRDFVSALSTTRFRQFAEAFDTVQAFVAKFKEMKMAFQGPVGDHKAMALACYDDLLRLQESLQHSPAMKVLQKTFPDKADGHGMPA
jgi:hypothetical protein